MQLDADVEMPSVLQHTHGSITALFFFPSIILLAKETDLDRVARTTAGAQIRFQNTNSHHQVEIGSVVLSPPHHGRKNARSTRLK